ncbi:unnamed protein product [Macrosiphum euphorbiae]|uniref:Uncharacterized protein n=1 Tax=Macrosiphum euphorbiae TaxID=13131 RepID=A0AAV0WP04_9HEMI|nr:unnamed protein product [Macrosiphum euphorbiae]
MFTNSSMKTPNLVNAIKEVVEAVQLTLLKVIAFKCDQASTNVAAINILKAETNAKYLRKSHKEKRNLGFELGGQEIVTLI